MRYAWGTSHILPLSDGQVYCTNCKFADGWVSLVYQVVFVEDSPEKVTMNFSSPPPSLSPPLLSSPTLLFLSFFTFLFHLFLPSSFFLYSPSFSLFLPLSPSFSLFLPLSTSLLPPCFPPVALLSILCLFSTLSLPFPPFFAFYLILLSRFVLSLFLLFTLPLCLSPSPSLAERSFPTPTA